MNLKQLNNKFKRIDKRLSIKFEEEAGELWLVLYSDGLYSNEKTTRVLALDLKSGFVFRENLEYANGIGGTETDIKELRKYLKACKLMIKVRKKHVIWRRNLGL